MSVEYRPVEELPLGAGDLRSWAREAEQALAQIARLAEGDDYVSRGQRLQAIRALANPWSRSRALAEQLRQ